jgi:hypothetical protein
MKYIIALAVGLAIGSTAMLAFAQVEVTASVPCNPINCDMPNQDTFTWFNSPVEGKQNITGYLYDGTFFYNIWITPERMLFVSGSDYWYVTPTGIEI